MEMTQVTHFLVLSLTRARVKSYLGKARHLRHLRHPLEACAGSYGHSTSLHVVGAGSKNPRDEGRSGLRFYAHNLPLIQFFPRRYYNYPHRTRHRIEANPCRNFSWSPSANGN